MLNRLQLLVLTGLLFFAAVPVVEGKEQGREREKARESTTSDLIAQAITRVTGIEVIETESGLELILKTSAGSERLY